MIEDVQELCDIFEKSDKCIISVFKIPIPFYILIYIEIRRNLLKILKFCLFTFLLTAAMLCFAFLSIMLCDMLQITTINSVIDSLYGLSLYLPIDVNDDRKCLVDNFLRESFRKPAKCDFCIGINNINVEYNLSDSHFLGKYAYSGIPVVVKGATQNWTARSLFSFKFFQTLYSYSLMVRTEEGINYISPFHRKVINSNSKIDILKFKENEKMLACQFFNYQTDFQSLEAFLSTNFTQLNYSIPWYVGWSNCDPMVSKVLRQHYSKPYFLSKHSESHNSDWIFMGYPGYGAKMHIDFVGRPSWQAQLTSKKLWRLRPPHECRLQCRNEVEIVVDEGDIIVLDTNLWYHQTEVVGKDISITIGAEYD